jgi:flagellar biogenesis protein FliO
MLIRIIFILSLSFFPLFAEEKEAPAPTPPPKESVEDNPSTTLLEGSFLENHLSDKSKAPTYEHAFIKMILTLAGLIFLVFFTLWALRKLSNGKIGGFSTQKKIKILEKRPLSPKTAIYLLELDGRQIFVAESQLEIKTLLNPHEVDLD